jgi:hypothetical protein
MTIRSLAEVGARLEKAVAGLPGRPTSPQDEFDRYEMLAIQILDSEYMDYGPQVLREYLMTRLYLKQLELGLVPDFH